MSELVTYTQAQRLKKLGFNRVVNDFYQDEDLEDSIKQVDFNSSGCSNVFSAPTVSESLDFIREKGIYCGVYPFMWGYKGMAIVQDRHNPCTIEVEPLGTHPLAESALLDAVLDYLEKK
ncbi:hypothetical protein E2605_07725 [Dysgonomonas capnocytophagoides]|uniref:Uncharacterized protein n=1 Tax=Dysgonomonas capnocytophagoides TaxID=45254 RepID=A0A4Y8L6L2_9BACT|nr:hypothetical protein [Dysgonomonas capnocytophagoides]TFD96700.1 hypothetical protein E2605_07725 [Dysgonomonas capnocytophagoides]